METYSRVKESVKSQERCFLGVFFGLTVLGFVIGILIGRFATCPDAEPEILPSVVERLMKDEDPTISPILINAIQGSNIKEYLRALSEKPHIGGSEENHKLAERIRDHWQEAGFDHVTMTPYEVMLSYPNMSDLNYVELLDDQGHSMYKSNLTEPVLTPEERQPNVVPPFNAYSGAGDITGDLVYVNYGRLEDYATLQQLGINVSGKIALARYGKIFRGDKARLAEVHGATGAILFSDPYDYASANATKVYPDDWWLPPSGSQRGSVFIGNGDPETPGYPSIEHAYRKLGQYPSNYIPSIPVHPIGYGIAIHLMREMDGDEVPAKWRGAMNVTYRFGNRFRTPGWKAHIRVSTKPQRRVIYNTIGIIRGRVEPDRYVIVGNHRDAWVFGAMDPGSGTAIMMEISRAMGDLVKSGQWRPRRSILFCSWGAEEYGLIGSTEWVEHYTKTLGARAVAYLNVDIAVAGNFSLEAGGTPLLYNSLFSATKKVPNPSHAEVTAGRTSVYDTWLHTKPWKNFDIPKVLSPGAGSDYAPFRDRIGIPVSDLRYTWDSEKLPLSSYPLYHSAYETFRAVERFIDPDFKYHATIGKIWSEMARHLADSLILPFKVSDYSFMVTELTSTLLGRFRQDLENNNIDTTLLSNAVANFSSTLTAFENKIKSINLNDPFEIRRVNDQLMQLDRAFLDPAGLPGRSLKRHILLAESVVDTYAGSSFPGLSDALTEIQQGHDVTEQWETVRKHYAVILFTIQSAASTMRDVTDFMNNYL